VFPVRAHPDMSVVLYARASQARDERSKSVDDQLTELRRWANREGWQVIAEFRDDNISASRYAKGKHRDGWEQTLHVVASGQVRALLVWDFSRSTRDLKVFAALEEMCRTHRVALGYSGRLRDLSTADGGFSVGMDALMAAKRSAEISEAVQLAAAHRAERGGPHAALPWGYRRVFDADTGKVVRYEIDPVRGPLVQEAVRRILDREPADSVARDFNGRGITTTAAGKCTSKCGCRATNSGQPNPHWEGEHIQFSGKWTGANLSKHVLRPALAGLRTRNGEVLDVKTTWPPLISVDDYYRLRVLYADPARDKWRNSTGRREVKHLGTGLFRCGRDGCDGRMRVVKNVGREATYDCRTCHKVGRRQALVDEIVEQVIIKRLTRPDILERLAGPETSEQRAKAASEVSALRAEEFDMRRLLREGRLTPVDFADWREGWTPRIQAAESMARPPQLPEALINMARSDAARRWEQASMATRRAVLDTLMIVTIRPMGRNRSELPFDPLRDIHWKSQ